jgi:hypothetical protein
METDTMNRLGTIQRGLSQSPRRTLVYGTHGIGKSSFGARFPGAIVLQTEDGLAGIGVDRFPLSETFADAMQCIASLHGEPHEYRTVVVDSVDWLERLIWAVVCEKRSVSSIEEIGYGKGYVYALEHWRRLIESLDLLRRDRGMAVVLIAHAAIERFHSPLTEPYDRFAPRLQKLASALVQEWVDEILFCSYRVDVRTVGEGFDRRRTLGVGNGTRVIHTTERPGHVAKNRLALPDELPLDFDAYAAAVAAALSNLQSKES